MRLHIANLRWPDPSWLHIANLRWPDPSFPVDLTRKREFQNCLVKREYTNWYRVDKSYTSVFRLNTSTNCRVFEGKYGKNGKSYSDKQKLTRACASILTTESPKKLPADARLLNGSSGRPQDLLKPHICHFDKCCWREVARLFFWAARRPSEAAYLSLWESLTFESCSTWGN